MNTSEHIEFIIYIYISINLHFQGKLCGEYMLSKVTKSAFNKCYSQGKMAKETFHKVWKKKVKKSSNHLKNLLKF